MSKNKLRQPDEVKKAELAIVQRTTEFLRTHPECVA